MVNNALEWSWEGPENEYWIGIHAETRHHVGVVEYCDDPGKWQGHWYFRMEPDSAFGAATMQAVAIKLTELETELQKLHEAADRA